jgi:hypothetical protein
MYDRFCYKTHHLNQKQNLRIPYKEKSEKGGRKKEDVKPIKPRVHEMR